MTVPANTRETYGAIGIREDLSNIIYNISPMDTPFMNGVGRGSCDNTTFEWQTDTLSDTATNRQAEGNDYSSTAATEPRRLTNFTQISATQVQSSGTAEAVDFAGRKSTQAYQLAKRAKEMKRDMEQMLLDGIARNVGAAGTARVSAGLPAWIAANYHSLGGAPSPPGLGSASSGIGTDTASDATSTGTLTEAGMKIVIAECFDNGGSPDTILVDSGNKQVISALTQTVSALRTAADKAAPASVVAAVDVYVSDFGTFKIIPDRFQRARDCWFIDFDFWAVAYLRPFRTETLAKTGDSVKQMLVAEYGLMSKNQKSSGFIADV